MAIFSNNQVRQFYVAGTVATATPAAEGEILVKKAKDGKVSILHYGKGGLTRTDIIDPKTVEYVKLTKAAAMAHTKRAIKVALDQNVNGGNPVVGQDYILRIVFKQYMSPDEGDQYVKEAAVRVTSGMGADKFYKELAKSLIRNFSREAVKLLDIYVDTTLVKTVADVEALQAANSITLQEVEQPWVLGTMPLTFVNFDVFADEILLNGTEETWGTAEVVDPLGTEKTIGNGKIIADMEYFYHGERGDQYRGIGWPNVIPTAYMVDSTKEYDILDIHYAYVGANHSIQKSEKDLTIAVVKGNTAVPNAVAGALGVTL